MEEGLRTPGKGLSFASPISSRLISKYRRDKSYNALDDGSPLHTSDSSKLKLRSVIFSEESNTDKQLDPRGSQSTDGRDEDEESDDRPNIEPYNLMHRENFAIAMSYFTVGFSMSFLQTPLNIYLVNTLNAEPDVQGTINILSTLPWSLKIIFGFISDAVPIFGMHRKPYLTLGCIIYSAAFLYYAYLAGIQDIHDEMILSYVILISTLGLIIVDVMGDTMCVQRSRFEPEMCKGQMQATCYSFRFGGAMLGAFLGMYTLSLIIPHYPLCVISIVTIIILTEPSLSTLCIHVCFTGSPHSHSHCTLLSQVQLLVIVAMHSPMQPGPAPTEVGRGASTLPMAITSTTTMIITMIITTMMKIMMSMVLLVAIVGLHSHHRYI